ncbi:hypothetical protein LR032_06050 [Candidatus Bipolaricaulota bacterium]|nr:hypothetical protein [Candidatus Bipolaricaulota bacterium]
MRQTLCIVTIAALVLLPVFATPAFAEAALSGSGDFAGTAVLSFSGTSITATLAGDLTLSGTIAYGGKAIPFTATGAFSGSAGGDTKALSGAAWLVFALRGALQTGEEIDIRGGLSIAGDDVSFTGGAAGEGAGPLYLEIRVFGTTIKLIGRVEASGSGGFVPPQDRYTMEIDGSGAMLFTAVAPASPEEDPSSGADEQSDWFDLSDWPEEEANQLLLLLETEHAEDGEGS